MPIARGRTARFRRSCRRRAVSMRPPAASRRLSCPPCPAARPALRPVLPPRRADPPAPDYAEARPKLVSCKLAGRSHEGRDIWLPSVTNMPPARPEKPALWVDGNIHAAELTASTACLYWLHQLLTATAATTGSRTCSTRAPSTSARASTPTAPSWRWPTSRATSVVDAALPVRRGAGRRPDDGGRRRRRPRAADAHPRPARRVQEAPRRSAARSRASRASSAASTSASFPRAR